MIKNLQIQNLILIDRAEIPFHPGLNVLSGETGSGKSALIEALQLVLGERADVGVIRKGCEKAVVEAIFDISQLPALARFLDESGIEVHDELIIRRELSLQGKSRAFINHQAAHIQLLKTIGTYLVEFVSQHANRELMQIEAHRKWLDAYGELGEQHRQFKISWQEEQELQERLAKLISSESERLRQIEIYRMEIDEITQGKLKEGEEEEIFAEYSRLTHSEEISHSLETLSELFSGEKHSILSHLKLSKPLFESLQKLDSTFDETTKLFEEGRILLQEVSHSLHRHMGKIEHNPNRAAALNERLTVINRLKKRFGPTIEQVQAYHKQALESLHSLEKADVEIEELQEKIAQVSRESNRLAQGLTQARKQSALQFEKAIVKELRQLNMPKVEFKIEVTQQKRSSFGDDRVEYFMAPNLGEHFIAVKESASGGELSRLLLVLKKLMAGKEATPTLLFDEVDANIGGETAAIIGEKLAEISRYHQLICITHFPQVAAKAEHHLQISKQELEGRTFTMIKSLNEKERKKELLRMVGRSA